MSERQEKKRRYNRLREYIFDFEWWLSTEPPMIRIFKWHKWKRSRPMLLGCIEDCSTIDAVLVVRCKECEYYNITCCSSGTGWCESMDRGVSDDFYCANGAKMGKEE